MTEKELAKAAASECQFLIGTVSRVVHTDEHLAYLMYREGCQFLIGTVSHPGSMSMVNVRRFVISLYVSIPHRYGITRVQFTAQRIERFWSSVNSS